MSADSDHSFVGQAQACVREAEEHKANGEWADALRAHLRAADLYQLATQTMTDVDSIRSLNLMSLSHKNKADELAAFVERRPELYAAPNANDDSTVPWSGVDNDPSESYMAHTQYLDMDDLMLSGSTHMFVGQRPSSSASNVSAEGRRILMYQSPIGADADASYADESVATLPIEAETMSSATPRSAIEQSGDVHLGFGSIGDDDSSLGPIPSVFLTGGATAATEGGDADGTTQTRLSLPDVAAHFWSGVETLMDMLPSQLTSSSLDSRRVDAHADEHVRGAADTDESSSEGGALHTLTSVSAPTSSVAPPRPSPSPDLMGDFVVMDKNAMVFDSYADGADEAASSAQTRSEPKLLAPAPRRRLFADSVRLGVRGEEASNAAERLRQVEAENALLRKSIDAFRQEVQRRADMVRQRRERVARCAPASASVFLPRNTSETASNIGATTDDSSTDASGTGGGGGRTRREMELEAQASVLTRKLELAMARVRHLEKLVAQHESRWQRMRHAKQQLRDGGARAASVDTAAASAAIKRGLVTPPRRPLSSGNGGASSGGLGGSNRGSEVRGSAAGADEHRRGGADRARATRRCSSSSPTKRVPPPRDDVKNSTSTTTKSVGVEEGDDTTSSLTTSDNRSVTPPANSSLRTAATTASSASPSAASAAASSNHNGNGNAKDPRRQSEMRMSMTRSASIDSDLDGEDEEAAAAAAAAAAARQRERRQSGDIQEE